jgi:hypothetical protein
MEVKVPALLTTEGITPTLDMPNLQSNVRYLKARLIVVRITTDKKTAIRIQD